MSGELFSDNDPGEIEQLTALVQRLQLREMAEKTDDLEGVTLIR